MEDFDVLKREATKLERHLEDRVAKYQQVRSSKVTLLYDTTSIQYNTNNTITNYIIIICSNNSIVSNSIGCSWLKR